MIEYPKGQQYFSGVGEIMSVSNQANPTLQQNLRLAEQINREVKHHPDSEYAGRFVGIANGRVVAVADDADEVIEQLEQFEPHASKCLCFEAGLDYDQPQDIWDVT